MRAALVLAACAVASPAPSAAPRPALRPQLRRLALLRGGGAVAKPALPAADSSYDLLPHSRRATECLTHFGVDPQQGLSEERAAELARRYGPNALEVEAGPSALALFLGQFEDRLVQVRPGHSPSPSPSPGPSPTVSHSHGLRLRLRRASLPRLAASDPAGGGGAVVPARVPRGRRGQGVGRADGDPRDPADQRAGEHVAGAERGRRPLRPAAPPARDRTLPPTGALPLPLPNPYPLPLPPSPRSSPRSSPSPSPSPSPTPRPREASGVG